MRSSFFFFGLTEKEKGSTKNEWRAAASLLALGGDGRDAAAGPAAAALAPASCVPVLLTLTQKRAVDDPHMTALAGMYFADASDCVEALVNARTASFSEAPALCSTLQPRTITFASSVPDAVRNRIVDELLAEKGDPERAECYHFDGRSPFPQKLEARAATKGTRDSAEEAEKEEESFNIFRLLEAERYDECRGLIPGSALSLLRRYRLFAPADARDAEEDEDEDDGEAWKGRPLPGAKHVAVLGGSFSPITNGHLVLARELMRAAGRGGLGGGPAVSPDKDVQKKNGAEDELPSQPSLIDELWIVPCGARPDKPSLNVSPLDRYKMTVLGVEAFFPLYEERKDRGEDKDGEHSEAVAADNARIRAAPWELKEPIALASFELLVNVLSKRFPDVRFSLVIGSDLIPTLESWRFADKLREQCNFLVVDRPGYTLEADAAAAAEASASSPSPFRYLQPSQAGGAKKAWLVRYLGPSGGQQLRLVRASSTQVRTAIGAKEAAGLASPPLDGDDEPFSAAASLVPAPVLAYIRGKRLYVSSSSSSSSSPA